MKIRFQVMFCTFFLMWFTLEQEAFPSSNISLQGRQLLVDGKPFTIKGVCYNPVPKGNIHPNNITTSPDENDLLKVERDFQLMRAAGINTVRTYTAIRDIRVLDLMENYGIYQIVPLLNSNDTSEEKVSDLVALLKDHPSTLMWQVGNEWNYNKLYDKSLDYEQAKARVKELGSLVKKLDSSLPLSTNYGEVPPLELVNELSDFDVWSLNIYAGKSFGSRFERWKALSNKPMYIGEFGVDAINVDRVDLESQRIATHDLLAELKKNLSSQVEDNAAIGGTIFSWVDGWWKDPKGSLHEQDMGGNAPGGGPYPDGIFNEEYWGVMTIDRVPRPAYTELKKAWRGFAE